MTLSHSDLLQTSISTFVRGESRLYFYSALGLSLALLTSLPTLHSKSLPQVVTNVAAPKRWKTTHMPMDEWINKRWPIQLMKYNSTFKRKKTLLHAATWMKLEYVMLCEISQSQKGKLLSDPLI